VPAASRIVISSYDEGWPGDFRILADRLQEALGDLAIRIDHIGSTAVPGLAAKDIIDIQIGVADLGDPRIAAALIGLGATPTDITTDHVPPGDPGSPADWEKRYFRPPASWRRTHLHVRETGRLNHRYALLFRDYLRHSLAAAAAYGQIKRALARHHPDDLDVYYDVKDPVCDLVMHAAERWAADVSWSAESSV